MIVAAKYTMSARLEQFNKTGRLESRRERPCSSVGCRVDSSDGSITLCIKNATANEVFVTKNVRIKKEIAGAQEKLSIWLADYNCIATLMGDNDDLQNLIQCLELHQRVDNDENVPRVENVKKENSYNHAIDSAKVATPEKPPSYSKGPISMAVQPKVIKTPSPTKDKGGLWKRKLGKPTIETKNIIKQNDNIQHQASPGKGSMITESPPSKGKPNGSPKGKVTLNSSPGSNTPQNKKTCNKITPKKNERKQLTMRSFLFSSQPPPPPPPQPNRLPKPALATRKPVISQPSYPSNTLDYKNKNITTAITTSSSSVSYPSDWSNPYTSSSSSTSTSTSSSSSSSSSQPSNKSAIHASKLTSDQKKILDSCVEGTSVFFTGSAGTGKSYLLGHIVDALIEKHGKGTVYVTATTGLAACAIGGTTIHQFAGLSGVDESDRTTWSSSVKLIMQRQQAVRRWKQARVLLIDEISMLGPDMLELLNLIAQTTRGSTKPMGGLQTILCGDFFQLPPVVKVRHVFTAPSLSQRQQSQGDDSSTGSHVAYPITHTNTNTTTAATDTNILSTCHASQQQQQKLTTTSSSATSTGTDSRVFCFQSPVWKQIVKKSFELKVVFRQNKTSFVSLLHAIRRGSNHKEIIEAFSECVGRDLDCGDGILPTQIYTHRSDVDALNSKELACLPGNIYEFKSTDSGEPSFVKTLLQHCPAKELLRLKEGAQVILVKTTDAQEGLVNGARGVIVRFTRDTKRPVVRFADGVERTICNETFTVSFGGRVVAERSQLPLELAWGISVHKSQGMSVDKAVVNLKKVFEFGQAYVALSRVRSMEGLCLGTPLLPCHIRAHPAVVQFYDELSH